MADVPIDPIGAARRLDTILGRTDLPYTYTDEDDVALRVDRGVCTAYDRPGRASVSFYAPKGEDAVRLAHAVLAAAGHTGHIVVSTEDSARAIRIRESVAAEDMRERAARVPAVIASSDPLAMRTVFEQIFALPLLDGDTDDRRPSLCGDAQSDLPPDQPATVHVATPEGITPCGEGHPDVTVTAIITEADCLTCLRTLAQAPQDDITETSEVARLTSERDRYRTAWESARRRAVNLRSRLRFWVTAWKGLKRESADLRVELRAESARVSAARDERDQALRAAREASGRLPAEDLVEPGDEVPALAELEERVERLARDHAVTTQRLAICEERLGLTAAGTNDEPQPCRVSSWHPDLPGAPLYCEHSAGAGHDGLHYADVMGHTRTWGGTEAQDDEPAPCEECGRPYAEQEHGPDGKCRHTPATRLGRPTT